MRRVQEIGSLYELKPCSIHWKETLELAQKERLDSVLVMRKPLAMQMEENSVASIQELDLLYSVHVLKPDP